MGGLQGHLRKDQWLHRLHMNTRGAAQCADGECCWLKKCAPCRTEPAPLHVAMALHEPVAPPPAPPREGGFSLFSFDCFERH